MPSSMNDTWLEVSSIAENKHLMGHASNNFRAHLSVCMCVINGDCQDAPPNADGVTAPTFMSAPFIYWKWVVEYDY